MELSLILPNVFQLRVIVRGISPLIWRRLLVRSNMSLATLHDMQQIVFAWSDVHLGSLAPHVQNFTLTAFLPSSPRRHNREIINESSGSRIFPTLHWVICST